jgi:hypothetical protein
MAVLKRKLTATPYEKWVLVYNQYPREFYVEIRTNGVVKRYSVEEAIKVAGSDDLRLAIVDMFK